jgi:Family of unknown function (DUF6158)
MTLHVGGTTLGAAWTSGRAQGIHVAGKLGLDPHRLDDEAMERELRHLYATREETFFRGTRQALLNHTDRMLQPEREYAGRFPERTTADALRIRKGPRLRAGQPAGRPWRNVEASLVPMRYRRRIVPVGNRPDASAFWDRSKS